MTKAIHRIARSLAVVGTLVVSGAAIAQTAFPTKPLRIVVPYPPGGTVDLVGRTMGMVLAQQLGQQVVVENKVGASGTIGADFVANSAPDGYTLLVNASLQVFNQYIMKSIRFDPFHTGTIHFRHCFLHIERMECPKGNTQFPVLCRIDFRGLITWF